MTGQPQIDITELLMAWRSGDQNALSRLTPVVYQELHRLAAAHMRREKAGHTLQTSALVNEAYIKLVDASRVRWQNRAHFFAVAAQLMRRILVDFARSRQYHKRGGDWQQVTLDEKLGVATRGDSDLVALDEALQKLAKLDPRKAQVIELRYFGGLSLEETCEALQVSTDTVG